MPYISILILLTLFLIIVLVVISFSKKIEIKVDQSTNEYKGVVFKNCMLTKTEKLYYWKLKKILPKNVILHTQISFNSFLKCDRIDIRNRYNRGVVDMIVTDKDFNVLLIIEVDDDSHTASRVKQKDALRDEITSAAGIPTIRINDSFNNTMIKKMIASHVKKMSIWTKIFSKF